MIEHEDADLSGSTFRNVNLSRSTFRGAFFNDVQIRDAWIEGTTIEGTIVSLEVNGVDVSRYVEDELDRRHPGRVHLRAATVDELRSAWSFWRGQFLDTTADARSTLGDDALTVRVDGEFSYLQTLRHLVFAYDRWLTGPMFGDPVPYFHPIGVTHTGATEGPADGIDLAANPTVDEILAVRHQQLDRIVTWLESASDDDLAAIVPSPNGGDTTAGDCQRVVLIEEFWHHQYATRDLAILAGETT